MPSGHAPRPAIIMPTHNPIAANVNHELTKMPSSTKARTSNKTSRLIHSRVGRAGVESLLIPILTRRPASRYIDFPCFGRNHWRTCGSKRGGL